MTIYVSGTDKAFNVALCAWNGNQYEPDCFGDFEEDLPLRYPMITKYVKYVYGIDCQAEMTQEDFDWLILYWQREVDDYNSGEPSCLGDPDDEDYNEAKKLRPRYTLFVDEALIDYSEIHRLRGG